jgi:hypothetical protein
MYQASVRGKDVGEKAAKPTTEVQLGFSFFSETVSSRLSPEITPRGFRAGARPRGLAETLAAARTVLLDAPIDDINTQLLSLLEFCEAALTRALDVAQIRGELPFSEEEHRSLRGIGHAQWLLAEEHSRREEKPVGRLVGKRTKGQEREGKWQKAETVGQKANSKKQKVNL